MVVKTITYTDFNGNERTEEHYFNISDAEMLQLEYSVSGGFTEMVKRIVSAQDNVTIMNTFNEIIDKSYGIKSADGREFVKSPEITRSFKQSGAYNKFFMDLCTKDGMAAEFCNSLFPSAASEDGVEPVKHSTVK